MATITFWTDQDTKAKLGRLATKLGRKPSGLLNLALQQLLKLNGENREAVVEADHGNALDSASKKVTARLRPQEFNKLKAAAESQGMKPGTWVAGLIRAKLDTGQTMNREEIAALRESTRQLQAIGRNLNQIARLTNIEWREAEKLKREHVVRLAADIKAHTERVAAVLAHSVNKWH
jgi:predicted transcriptional regulator